MDPSDRPTPRQLAAELVGVLRDVPALLMAPLFRRRHLRWGATDLEAGARLAGDELVPRARFVATRAITIDAPPIAVWPWLAQVGGGRAGFYSHDLLDNLGRPSATTILPQFQTVEIGQWVPLSPLAAPSAKTALVVHSYLAGDWLLWTGSGSTWFWQLTPTDDGGTRLVTRIRATYDWTHPVTAMVGVVLMEFGDFAMMRAMLRGIKRRAESRSRTAAG